MKICICDEDSSFIQEIGKRFPLIQTVIEFSAFSSARSLLESCKNGVCFDILFISIELKGINGIEAAEIIRALSPRTIIVFVSGQSDCIFDAFVSKGLHFLIKPVSDRQFREVLTSVLNQYRALNASIVLKWESTRNKIQIDKISFVEGYRRHLTVHTADGVYEAVGKISEMQEILSPHGFVRVHQGFIVNMNYIKCFSYNEIELTDGSRIPISVRKKQDALKIYDDYIKEDCILK